MKYRHLPIFALLFYFSTPNLSAQVSLGLKGHVSNADAPLVQRLDLFSKRNRLLLNPGFSLYAEIPINRRWSWQPEFLLRQYEAHYQIQTSEPTIHISRLQYLYFSFFAKHNYPVNQWNLVFLGGFNLGYATKLEAEESIGLFPYQEFIERDVDFDRDGVKRFDYGLSFGIGLERKIAKQLRTNLNLRYDFGFQDIMKSNNSTFHNRGFMLEMGILIPLKLKK